MPPPLPPPSRAGDTIHGVHFAHHSPIHARSPPRPLLWLPSPAAANAPPARMTISAKGLNMAFLRSGAEFRVATNASPELQRFNTMRTRGRDARANDFAAKMLAGKPVPA